MIIFSGYYTPYTPPGIVRVSCISRDKMAVAVHHRLTCGNADIITDIISIRYKVLFEDKPAFIDKISHGFFLFYGKTEIIGGMPEGNNKQVTFRYRETIPSGIT
jgi:hypothetical protein